MSDSIRVNLDEYRVRPDEPFRLSRIRPDDTQDVPGKSAAKAQLKENVKAIAHLQEQLFAEGRQSVLLVLQAMDAGGKDSTIEAVTRGLNPHGVVVTGFKAPSTEALAHDFLWRIHRHAPRKGRIAIFNRSHYEDVLIVRVNGWAPEALVEKRYEHINDFERLLHDHGTRIIKVMLHISPEYQLEQFKERLVEEDKHWKFNPEDLEKRAQWGDYMDAFEQALTRCSTPYAPWYVIPAEHKWFRVLAVSQLLLETLDAMNPSFPEPEYDAAQYPAKRLKELDPLSTS